MAISAADVKNLREMTGVGMMDCKKALTECDGDIDKAIEYLREKGLAASAKKAGRIAAEGMAYAAVVDGIGVIVEVNAESDFVAKNADFQNFVKALAEIVAESDGLAQILVEPQRPGNGPGHLGHFQRVGQAGAIEVALRREEHLRFLLETPEGLAVQHPVAVPLKHRAQRVLRLRHDSAAACIAEGRPRCKGKVFDFLGSPAHIHTDPPFIFRASPPPLCTQPIPIAALQQL